MTVVWSLAPLACTVLAVRISKAEIRAQIRAQIVALAPCPCTHARNET